MDDAARGRRRMPTEYSGCCGTCSHAYFVYKLLSGLYMLEGWEIAIFNFFVLSMLTVLTFGLVQLVAWTFGIHASVPLTFLDVMRSLLAATESATAAGAAPRDL